MLAKKVQGAGGVGGEAGLHAYVAASVSDMLTAIDISPPSSMTISDAYYDATVFNNIAAVATDPTRGLAFTQNYTTGSGYLASVDISDPTNLSILDSISGQQRAEAVAVDAVNEVVFNVDVVPFTSPRRYELQSWDYSNPSSLTLLDTLSIFNDPGSNMVVDAVNELLFVNSNSGGSSYINVIGISNASNLTWLARLGPLTYDSYEMAVDPTSSVLYVARRTSGSPSFGVLTSIDYSTPTSPSILQQYNGPSSSYYNAHGIGLDLVNDVVFLAVWRSVGGVFSYGLASVDVSNPSSMSELDNVTTTDLTNRENYLAYNDQDGTVYITNDSTYTVVSFDVSNPSSLSQLGTITSISDLNYASKIALG
jgi:hypothetical protein